MCWGFVLFWQLRPYSLQQQTQRILSSSSIASCTARVYSHRGMTSGKITNVQLTMNLEGSHFYGTGL